MLDLMGFINKKEKAAPSGESTPLLLQPSNSNGDNAVAANSGGTSQQPEFYFLNRGPSIAEGGTSAAHHEEEVEEIPPGASTDEFAPKQLVSSSTSMPVASPSPSQRKHVTGDPVGAAAGVSNNTGSGGFWINLFGGGKNKQQNIANQNAVGTLLKPRKAPIKVEPKVFFANERTFLAWMHLSVMLAGASIAILAFAEDRNPVSQLYGVLLLPVAMAFILYSMYQYARRAYMLRTRHPGPYEDTVGPAFLGVILMISIVAQFALKLYSMAG